MSKMVHTPLGPYTMWVHIFLDALNVLTNYTMTNNGKDRRCILPPILSSAVYGKYQRIHAGHDF